LNSQLRMIDKSYTMKTNITKLLTALLLMSFFAVDAQQAAQDDHHHHQHIDPFYLPLDFDKDSLIGFDELSAKIEAARYADEAWEQERIVAVLKRNFINFKYGFTAPVPNPGVQQPCTNPDFENGTISGWTAAQGPSNNSLTMAGCCPNTTSQIVTVTPGNDPNLGAALPRVPAGGGNFAARLGPTGSSSGGTAYRLSQTFTVTPANSVFIYRYAVVLNKAPHSCSQQPFFNVSFRDCNNNPIPCGQYNVTAAGSACSTGGDPSFITTNATWAYKPWTTAAFDLSSYIGQCVKIEFTVAGCVASQGAHGGYAYVDASCAPMTLNLNGSDIPVGQTNSASCGAVSNNTLCAPPGFSYNWTGPGVTGQTGQCINAAIAGTYSVSLGIPGATTCSFSPILYSNFTYSPNPTVSASVTQPVCANPAGSATVTATGGSGSYTYSWTPTAPSASVNVNLPTNTMYTVTAVDASGCQGSTTFSINPYPPAPAYTLSTIPGLVLSCQNPTINMTFAPTNSATTTQWSGPSGPITGTTIAVTNAGVYTYTAINTVSTCSLTGSVNITGNVIYPVLTSTLSQPSCTLPVGSGTVAASGVGPFTYTWTSAAGQPTVGLPYYTENTNLPPGSTYTVYATDPSGCTGSTTVAVNPFSGAASYTLSNSPGGPLTCPSPSTTLTFAPTNTNTTTQWEGPFGTITGTTTVANQSGVYSYTATNSVSGCVVTGTVGVVSNIAIPTATLAILCNTTGIHLDATSSSPDVVLSWAGPTSTVSLGNPVNSTAVGVFTLTATNPINGCVNTYTAISGYPSVSLTSSPGNTITCITQTVAVTAVPTPTNANVSWSNGTATVTTNPYPVTSAGTYTAYIQVPNGCATQSVITIGANTNADVFVSSTSSVIPCSTGSLALNASSSGSNPYTYSWTPSSPPFAGPVYQATTPGSYTITATNNANGCSTTTVVTVGQESINASFTNNPSQGLMPLSVTFTNTSINPTSTTYSWDMGNAMTYTTTNAATVYNNAGTYTVVLTATNGVCTATASATIFVDLVSMFTVPNVFTPNGDGKNDVFRLTAVNVGEINMTIFDRWGLKMFESTDHGKMEWDGKTKGGNLVTDGTYFYIIHAKGLDDQEYNLQGSVTVFQ